MKFNINSDQVFPVSIVIIALAIFMIGSLYAGERKDNTMLKMPPTRDFEEFDLKKDSFYFSDEKTLQLIKACEKNDLELAKKLITQGANPNDVGPRDNKYNQFSVLHILIAKNKPLPVKNMMIVGGKIDQEVKVGVAASPFVLAVILNRVEILEEIFKTWPISTFDQKLISDSMFKSIILGRPRIMKLFLDLGMSVDTIDSAGYSLIMRAIGSLDFEFAEWLLALGARLDIETIKGVNAPNSLELIMGRLNKESESYKKALKLMQAMREKGIIFPVETSKSIRERKKN